MVNDNNSYKNGYLERKSNDKYEGNIVIEGIDLSPITGVFFKQDGKNYLWLRRKDILEYDYEQQQYTPRKREPRWEAYLEKQISDGNVSFKGEFHFMRIRFSVVGIWDGVLGMDKHRMNFFVERLPMEKQDIINGINQRNRNG